MRPALVYDITRLFELRGSPSPTGIDRVDFACLDYFSARGFDICHVLRVQDVAQPVLPEAADALLRHLRKRWREGDLSAESDPEVSRLAALTLLPDALRIAAATVEATARTRRDGAIYLNMNHWGLDKAGFLSSAIGPFAKGGTFYLHDLLPIQFPEYFKPGDKEVHERRWLNLLPFQHSLVTNSYATREELKLFYGRLGIVDFPDPEVVGIGVEPIFHREPPRQETVEGPPTFVMLSTVEPRKNHLLILNIWRQMAQTLPPAEMPFLEIIGKRGWENQSITRMLESCEAIHPFIRERSSVPDSEIIASLGRARALLYPSFGEGWGMPIVEAMAMGVPVIASDIPVIREASQNLADYISPIDGLGWMEAIIDYSRQDSVRRTRSAQTGRAFKPLRWETVLNKIEAHVVRFAEGMSEKRLRPFALKLHVPATPSFQATAVPAPSDCKDTDIEFAVRNYLEQTSRSEQVSKPPRWRRSAQVKHRQDEPLNDYGLFVRAGNFYRDRGELKLAISCYRKAVSLRSDARHIWVQLGNMLKDAQFYGQAEDAYMQAFALDPQEADCWLQFGHLNNLRSRPDLALACYQQAVYYDPSHDEAYLHIEHMREQLTYAR